MKKSLKNLKKLFNNILHPTFFKVLTSIINQNKNLIPFIGV